MRIIIKFFPEITIKSSSVRLFFIKTLNKNVCNVLKHFNYVKKIKWYWDYIEIVLDKKDSIVDIIAILLRVPGIHHILLVKKYFFRNVSDIFEKIILIYRHRLIGKSFCVRVKRYGIHNFTSSDLERYLGEMLCKYVENSYVKLKNSEEIISLEVKTNYFFLLENRYEGLCGFPLGTQGDVLSLISGGFDSSIASYMLIRRGCKVHYCFFKLGGDRHENEVFNLAYYLWSKFSCSHAVKFISVDFSSVLNEILKNVSNSQMGIVLKRMMIRASTSIAKSLNISALVTGESLGQVSSQTLINLKLINDVTDVMIFRPLISHDKERIISLSRKIGIERFVISIPEYCGIISNRPTARGFQHFVEYEEKKINYEILNASVDQRKIIDIREFISESNYRMSDIRFISELNDKYIVIDIRAREDRESNPLCLDTVEIQNIPFYKLLDVFFNLDQSKMYLLYCGRGVMSHHHAMRLREKGFNNVNVYLPS